MIESEIGVVVFLICGSGLIGAIFAIVCCFLLDLANRICRYVKRKRSKWRKR